LCIQSDAGKELESASLCFCIAYDTGANVHTTPTGLRSEKSGWKSFFMHPNVQMLVAIRGKESELFLL